MKYSFFYALLFFIGLSVNAQNNQDELQLMQSLYGMDKRDIVEEFVEVSEEQNADFWRLYDEYEIKRKELERVDTNSCKNT